MTTTFIFFLGYIVLLLGGGYVVTRKWDYTPTTALTKKASDINRLTNQYNDVIHALEDAFEMDKAQQGRSLCRSSIKRKYSKRYTALEREYQRKRRAMLYAWEQMNPAWCKARKAWGWVYVIGAISAMVCCSSSLHFERVSSPTTVMSSTEERYWNADNIPIPHLQDASQYVSNPDKVLAQSTVDEMNHTLQRLDKELNIESVVIVVNYIENDDPFRFAQDVGNKYGVGRNDRGLMVVVGYQDHSINISPGKGLEGDLTDAECYRLQQRYVVPAMRAEMPDSAMLYLTEAIFATMQKKDLPEMSSLTSQQDEIDDETAIMIGLYIFFLIVWSIIFIRLNQKYHWLGITGATSTLLSNPFYEAESSGGGYGGGFGGSGFSSGSSGGSFGGGSFGGGGATSRW